MIVLLLSIPSAWAWQSECYTTEEGKTETVYRLCEDGKEKARNRWRPEPGVIYEHHDLAIPEHALLWDSALLRAGLPEELLSEFELRTFGGLEDSWVPVDADPLFVIERTVDLGQLTQLPDMSYTLYDWASGNESCPVDASLDPEKCHVFEKHMGSYNSSHFLPQARVFYTHYHALALDRAGRCAELSAELSGRSDLDEYLLACEREALAMEAVGQHYLQDAWSSGHMWERWGSPAASDWDKLGTAVAVAAASGLWHGVKGLAEKKFPKYDWDDAMCAPPPAGEAVLYVDGKDASLQHAVGDLFLNFAQNSSKHTPQLDALYGCSIAGMRDVYAATGMKHGELLEVAEGTELRDVGSDACWEQRVTNQSLQSGSQLHVGTYPSQRSYSIGGGLMGAALKFRFLLDGEVSIDSRAFWKDYNRHSAELALLAKDAPQGTEAARGFYGVEDPSLLGMLPNGGYETLPDWLDPAYPWDPNVIQEQWLSLLFADSHAAERCETATPEYLHNLRLLDQLGEEEERTARLAFCEQMAKPHLRIGTEASYHPLDPLCGVLDGRVVYSGHHNGAAVDPDQGVKDWCQGTLLLDGQFESGESETAWELYGEAQISSGIYTVIPHTGSSMLDLYIREWGDHAYARGSQRLLAPVPTEGAEFVFRWRVLAKDDYFRFGCESADPRFLVRLDSGEYGQDGEVLLNVPASDWCGDDAVKDYGSWKLSPWSDEVTIRLGPKEDPILSFVSLVNSGVYDVHVLVDSVRRVK